MLRARRRHVGGAGRSPHGERGLKCLNDQLEEAMLRRSPHGERGLKYLGTTTPLTITGVALLTESVD